jgi:hypothetical protein
MLKLNTLKPRLQQLSSKPVKQGGWQAARSGLTTTERGYGWAWQKARERVLRRDCGLCQPCDKANRVRAATQVDHVICKAEWQFLHGSLDGCDVDENLQSICDPCHAAKTENEARRAVADGWSPALAPLACRRKTDTPGGGGEAPKAGST